MQLRTAGRSAAVSRPLLPELPATSLPYVHVTSVIEEQAEQLVKPESLALGPFGLIAGIAAVIIAAQSIGRLVRLSTGDREVLRSLGADATETTLDGLPGLALSIVLGVLVAAVVAILLSPLAPFGPVREVEPVHRISFDWTVLGFGAAALLAALLGMALLFSFRDAPHRAASRLRWSSGRNAVLANAMASSRLSVEANTGIRLALDAGRGRSAVPVRSAIVGTVLAVVLVVASLTFGNSLSTFISHPTLYGWNWNYILESNAGYGDMPSGPSNRLLAADHDVVRWTGGFYTLLTIDGQSIPVLGEPPGGAVQPSILDGHDLRAENQVVLGTETLQNLHKSVGQTVTTGTGTATGHPDHRRDGHHAHRGRGPRTPPVHGYRRDCWMSRSSRHCSATSSSMPRLGRTSTSSAPVPVSVLRRPTAP